MKQICDMASKQANRLSVPAYAPLSGFHICQRLVLGVLALILLAVPSFAGSINYTYDGLGRLTGVGRADGFTITYTYDELGNRLAKAITGSATSVPGAPSIGTATAGNAQATIAFTAPASNGGIPIISYTVTANPGGLSVSSDASPITIIGLTNGTAYTFTVTATNAIGTSTASAASNSVIPATVPGAPTIGIAMAGSGYGIVNFSPPSSNGGKAISTYTVTSNPGGKTASGSVSPLTVPGLTNGTAYTFTVTATNAVGIGVPSSVSNSVTPSALDQDGDGLLDGLDAFPNDPTEWVDSDHDGVGDNRDNCPSVANPTQADADHDAIGDACDGSPTTANYGSVIDAPHNEARGIKCVDCHSYSLWWQHSPVTASTTPNYAAITNAVCAKCHSHATHASNPPGAWSMKCVDCHSAHHQAQLDWRETPADADALYLAQGTITGNFVVNRGQTTFNYSLLSIASEWADYSTWGNKSTLPPKGLILVVDTTDATNTYEVISATATTITIKGGIDPDKAGKTFGLIYGQMIKQTIITPALVSKSVKFFNPKKAGGGYTDSDTPVTGICQVCHAKTTMSWNSSGSGSNPGHDSGVNCTGCHTMAQGFKP